MGALQWAAGGRGRTNGMHEYSLTRQIVKIVNRTAEAHAARRVTRVRLVVGGGSGVQPDSVQAYFSQIARGTPAEGATLSVRRVPVEMYCPACDRNFIRPRFSFACPVCGALGAPTDVGAECYVESVELETDDPPPLKG
jgi:hydrogenase nickel incorporation protein HypA/HybF